MKPARLLSALLPATLLAADADLILHGGKVVTVDPGVSVAEAIAVKGGRIVTVGRTADILKRERGLRTQMIDLQGRTVLPGLTDAHVHALGAALSESRAPVPVLHSHAGVQRYIRDQASKTPKGEWILAPKTFPTRLLEMRIPTREVLDAALENPVFYDASYASAVNTYALKKSGITRETPDSPGSCILRDEKGEPIGILTRGATSLFKGVVSPETMRYFIPLRSFVNAGVIFAGGTDHMVGWDKNTAINAYNPFLGMWIAITRKTTQGEVIYPEERLSREQALRMYTIWPAYLQHSEKDRGSIETGKLADLVVLDRDYLTCPEDEIKAIAPVMTIVGGRIAYSR